jgi:hypothetical protein
LSPEEEYWDINSSKELSLLLHAIHRPFYWWILKNTISSLVLKILIKKSSKQENLNLFIDSIL